MKLFTADAASWLLAERDPDIDLAFGLCGPEFGCVSLQKLLTAREHRRIITCSPAFWPASLLRSRIFSELEWISFRW